MIKSFLNFFNKKGYTLIKISDFKFIIISQLYFIVEVKELSNKNFYFDIKIKKKLFSKPLKILNFEYYNFCLPFTTYFVKKEVNSLFENSLLNILNNNNLNLIEELSIFFKTDFLKIRFKKDNFGILNLNHIEYIYNIKKFEQFFLFENELFENLSKKKDPILQLLDFFYFNNIDFKIIKNDNKFVSFFNNKKFKSSNKEECINFLINEFIKDKNSNKIIKKHLETKEIIKEHEELSIEHFSLYKIMKY